MAKAMTGKAKGAEGFVGKGGRPAPPASAEELKKRGREHAALVRKAARVEAARTEAREWLKDMTRYGGPGRKHARVALQMIEAR